MLYNYNTGTKISFSSEIKLFCVLLGWEQKLVWGNTLLYSGHTYARKHMALTELTGIENTCHRNQVLMTFRIKRQNVKVGVAEDGLIFLPKEKLQASSCLV